uniref:ORFL5L n=1 Tax=Tanapox virus TaxID=99000 RepID=Q9QQT0_9POXV|nr:ORFL5L [Tanapox virus]
MYVSSLFEQKNKHAFAKFVWIFIHIHMKRCIFIIV